MKPVLVVGEKADTRVAIRDSLVHAGYVAVEAGSGKQALDLLFSTEHQEPRLIVLDLEMTVMSGWEFLAIARSYTRLASIPVLVISCEQEDLEALNRGAVVAHLAKPVDPERLLATVLRVAQEHGYLAPRL